MLSLHFRNYEMEKCNTSWNGKNKVLPMGLWCCNRGMYKTQGRIFCTLSELGLNYFPGRLGLEVAVVGFERSHFDLSKLCGLRQMT